MIDALSETRTALANGRPAVVGTQLQQYLAAGAYPEGGARAPHLHPASCPVSIVDAAAGRIAIQSDPPRTKFALVGFSQTTREMAPYNDPTWVVAGLNQLARYMPRADLWFELHQRDVWMGDQVRGTDYAQWLRDAPFPVFMESTDYDRGRFADLPQAVRFPLEACNEFVGPIFRPDGTVVKLDYYESSIALEIAWAALMGFEEIGIWGVDLIVEEEYGYQKPNAEFWLGFCQGRGIKLTIPEQSALLKGSPQRYGLVQPDYGPFSLKFFDAIIRTALEKREQLMTDLNACDGSINTMRNLRDAMLIYQRGGTLHSVEKINHPST